MLPAQLRPLGEFVLRAGIVHLPLELNDLAFQFALFLRILVQGRREFEVEEPYLGKIVKGHADRHELGGCGRDAQGCQWLLRQWYSLGK
jgi:hypothetical protein